MPVLDDDIDLSWFEAGSGIFDGIIDDPSCFPPLDDRAAQREWLGGFAGAWAELASLPPMAAGEDLRQRPVVEVLTDTLSDRPELLQQHLTIGACHLSVSCRQFDRPY